MKTKIIIILALALMLLATSTVNASIPFPNTLTADVEFGYAQLHPIGIMYSGQKFNIVGPNENGYTRVRFERIPTTTLYILTSELIGKYISSLPSTPVPPTRQTR
jgi:hypothetical protein